MLSILIVSLLSVYSSKLAFAKTLTVAVIDTGIDVTVPKQCKYGSRSFVGRSYSDDNGHGSHIAGLIVKNAGDLDYCLVSIKYYSDHNTGLQNLNNMIAALRYAINLKVDFINISGGGPEPDPLERALIKKALDSGITVVVAAGNERHNLSKTCNYFPACYDTKRLVVVGNLDGPSRAPSSNYGKPVNRWEIGTNLRSYVVSNFLGHPRYDFMTGTSQATAVATGKLIKRRLTR